MRGDPPDAARGGAGGRSGARRQLSAHGKGLYAIDRHGKPVGNGILSSDNRAAATAAELRRAGVDAQTYPRSLQPLWPSHPALLLRWLKQRQPAQYAAVDRILMAHDYLRFRLTGEAAAEVTNISGSNLFNQRSGAYDSALMAAFGIEEAQEKIAPTIGSAQLAGRVTAAAAAQCGLRTGTAVYGGLFDVVGAALSSGVADDRTLSAVAGTWSIATCVTERIIPADYPYAWGATASTAAISCTKAARPRPAIWPGSCASSAPTTGSATPSSTPGWPSAASSPAGCCSCRICTAPTSAATRRAG